VIKVNKRLTGPELCPKVLPGHHFPRGFQQHSQYLERLLTHLHFCPELAQFAGAQIKRIGAEQCCSCGGHLHVRKSEGMSVLTPGNAVG